MTRRVIVIGSGGHASVVADALLCAGVDVIGFTDREPSRHGTTRCGLPVLGGDDALERHPRAEVDLANGIGGSRGEATRRDVQLRLASQGWRFVGVRHPSAVVSRFADIAADAQVLAGSVVQAGARIGEGCIVNTAAVIEHDAVLEAWVHVAPRAVVCGGSRIGARSHVGAGAVVRQAISIGPDTLIGAGAVVLRDFEAGGTLAGVPARAMEASR